MTAENTDVRGLLAATTEHLRAELTALSESGASFHPAPGEWCAKEVVGHLIEADRRGFSGRIAVMVSEDRPRLEAWDQVGVAAARRDCGRPWTDVLAEFEQIRDEGLAIVDHLAPDDLERIGLHPVVGELRVSDVLHEWPFHDRDHLRQLLENTRAMLWPDMGNTRGFSVPS